MEERLEKLKAIIRSYESALVAFSGGADSAFVLKVARDALGRSKVRAVTAKSASLPARALVDSEDLARLIDVEQIVIETDEIEKPDYAANPADRCYFCKQTLYEAMRPIAERGHFKVIANGTNVDDLRDDRPGLRAAEEFFVRSPLVEAGFTKADVRHFSELLGLPTWDKPAEACLASRVPYGEPVTREKLSQIERAEGFLKDLGFRVVRVRHHGSLARIEIGRDEMARFHDDELRVRVAKALGDLGFTYVSLDLAGYRTGSLNEGKKGTQY